MQEAKRVEKLQKLTDIKTFWDDVRKITKHVSSDHALNQWQILAELRYDELKRGL